MFGFRKQAIKQGLRQRGLSALAMSYLLFSLAPHFGTLTHTHSGGDHPHHHQAASAHDAALERVLFSASLAPSPEASPQTEVASREASLGDLPLETGTPGLRDKSNRHSHGQEQPNLLALGSVALPVQLVFAPLPRRETPVTFVTERAALRASARAPPARPVA